jgi:MFS family permease
MPLAMTLLSAAFEPAQRGRALGIFGSVTGLAVLSGPLVGGAIAQGLAWEWIFWLNIPIGLLVIALVLLRVPESFGTAHSSRRSWPAPGDGRFSRGGVGTGSRQQCWLEQL